MWYPANAVVGVHERVLTLLHAEFEGLSRCSRNLLLPSAVGAAIGTMKALREYCASTLGGRYYVVTMIVFLPKHFSFLGETF